MTASPKLERESHIKAATQPLTSSEAEEGKHMMVSEEQRTREAIENKKRSIQSSLTEGNFDTKTLANPIHPLDSIRLFSLGVKRTKIDKSAMTTTSRDTSSLSTTGDGVTPQVMTSLAKSESPTSIEISGPSGSRSSPSIVLSDSERHRLRHPRDYHDREKLSEVSEEYSYYHHHHHHHQHRTYNNTRRDYSLRDLHSRMFSERDRRNDSRFSSRK
jgi:hypothetical protein